MNQRRIITGAACLFAALTLAAGASAKISVQKDDDDNRGRAAALWEEAVRAKGGHERLRSIRSLLISSTVDVQAQRGGGETEAERLYVMPGKVWRYTHTPDVYVSTDATVINVERGLCVVTLWPHSNGVPPLSLCLPTTTTQYLIQDPVIYLMETNWVRPVPVGARTEGKGKKQLDVVETEVGKMRLDFYLDRKTRLPVRIVTEWYGGITQAGPLGPMTVELGDYAAVDGVLMPRRVTRKPRIGEGSAAEVSREDAERARYLFNVEYDPVIFDGPAPKNVKRGDWKPKVSR
jgi:hypothetical protein